MKTKTIKFLMLCMVSMTMTLVGCNNDDGGTTPPPPAEATCDDGIMNGDETGVDCGGSCTACTPEPSTVLNGSTTEDLTLNPALEYQLTGTFSVESGATLTIPAGTRIVADVEEGENTSTYIVIQKGAQINVQGTSANPVVMTSANESPGDWGGLVILGDATTTAGVDATAEVGQLTYGGSKRR